MHALEGTIRDYPWGSRSIIAELQGRPTPSDGPEAEYWLGAHPAAPATVHRAGARIGLPQLLAAEPGHWLGAAALERFGPRLPFLLKLLAPERPLSLQAHPDAEQARVGYAAEEAAGEHHNYVDPYHKPELLVAVKPFEALCGFREPARSADALARLGVAALAPVVAALRTGPAGLADAVRRLLTWPEGERGELVAAAARCAATAATADSDLLRHLAAEYPGDPGVLVALLLNHVHLAPGQAIWMPPGNLHAYLRGCGVEILAASDNVLRGGLTPKRVDVPELLRVLRFEVLSDPVVAAVPVAPGVVTWRTPVEDFALHRVQLEDSAAELDPAGPRVVLCVDGRLAVRDGTDVVALEGGQAAFGAAGAGPLILTGRGEAYIGSVGLTESPAGGRQSGGTAPAAQGAGSGNARLTA